MNFLQRMIPTSTSQSWRPQSGQNSTALHLNICWTDDSIIYNFNSFANLSFYRKKPPSEPGLRVAAICHDGLGARGGTSPFWWESSLSSYTEVFSGGWEGCFPIHLWMDLDCYLHLCAKSHFQPHRAARFIFELSLTSWVFWWRTLKAKSVWILYIFKFYKLLNSTKYISFKEPLLILLQSVHPNSNNNNVFMCLCHLN